MNNTSKKSKLNVTPEKLDAFARRLFGRLEALRECQKHNKRMNAGKVKR